MHDLEGKVAVITGGGGGIGLATGRLLASRGVKVVLADVHEGRLDEAVTSCRKDGLDITGFPTDVSEFSSVRALADHVFSVHQTVHILHLNAGIAGPASFFDDQTDAWERIVGINLMGVVWGIKAFIPRMIAGGQEGVVLATSSGAGAEGTTHNTPAYAATKNAVVSVIECLYGQLRGMGSVVRASLVFPPLTATNLSGPPDNMKTVERHLRSSGVPAVLVQPEAVARMIVDGIERDRFFIRTGVRENDEFFDGGHSREFFAWNEQMVRGRSEAQLSDGVPDAYLW